jgi:FAD:protein FMN transferase
LKTSTDNSSPFRPTAPLARRVLNGTTMGTRYSAVFYASGTANIDSLAKALFEAVDRVDRQMSTWKPKSDLNRLNAAPVGEWMTVPRELMTVLAEALRIGLYTQGAFDIGVGALVDAWGFGPAGPRPDRGRIAAASTDRRAATTEALQLDVAGGRVRKIASLSLDLSGIAKGFGVDEMARVMDEFGMPAWLVGIDGEMRAKGFKPDGSPWAVAHERPDRYIRDAMGVIELTDMAIATSGNYRRWLAIDGRIVSHTIEPATGKPLKNAIASVSVVAPSCLTADALATALLVSGADDGIRLARVAGVDAIFVFGDGTVRTSYC